MALKELILAYSFENHHHLISIQLNHLVYQFEHQLLKVIRSPLNQDLLKLPNDLVDSMYKIVLPTSGVGQHLDRKSTRLNSSHVSISYAVFCLTPPPPTSTLFPYTTLFRSIFI